MRLPLTLLLQSSRSLSIALVIAHLLAAVAVALTQLPLTIKLGLGVLLALSLMFVLKRPVVSSLILHADGDLTLIFRDGCESKGAVAPSTTVFPWLVVLRMQTARGTQALILPVDALGDDGHRQLRVWLKWKANVVASA